jgi:hypothetical protein
VNIKQAIDRFLNLLPIVSRALVITPEPKLKPNRTEDIMIQQALDKVFEYYKTYRPKNTAKSYKSKQRE